MWAYEKRIGLQGLIDAYLHGCHEFHETAEFLEVTDEFLHNALTAYRSKYGIYVECGEYYIIFEPYLSIAKKIGAVKKRP